MPNTSEETWKQILLQIEGKLPPNSFLTWFGPLRCNGIQEGKIQIGVPNQFFYEFLDTHYRELIRGAIAEVSQGQLRPGFQIMEPREVEAAASEAPQFSDQPPSDGDFDKRTQLNPRYTIENFVEGDGNSFARAAALAVAEAPGKTPFNPLFIYGRSGLGKTHLVQAVGNFSLARNKSLRAIYVTSEKFVSDFIFAIKAYKTTDFSRFYRGVDLLLLDDVQFFQGKERTQMEFFHTFNTLYQTGKQIVLSSDRPPKELGDFDTRLISRIGSGLVADIQVPDYETRLAILEKRSEREGFPLPEDVAQYLAHNITDNIRDLESALIRLIAHCSIIGADVNLNLAKSILQGYVHQIKPKENISIASIQEIVARQYNVATDQLIARNRKKEIAWARQVAMYLCAELTNSSLQSIGTYFGNRDHSTVIHARDLVTKQITHDDHFAQLITKLKEEISSSE